MPLTDTTREEIARGIHGALCKADVLHYLGMPDDTPERCITAIEPIINHLIAEARADERRTLLAAIGDPLWRGLCKLQHFMGMAKGDGRDGKIWQSLHQGSDILWALWVSQEFSAALKTKDNPHG